MAGELMARLDVDHLGGAKVFRPCSINGRRYVSGEEVPITELRTIKRQNLKAMVDQRMLVCWPAVSDRPPVVIAPEGEVFVYNRTGTPTYDVIVGRRLNARPLSKAEADKTAAEAMAEKKEPETAE